MTMTTLKRLTAGSAVVAMLATAWPAAAQISAQFTRFQTIRASQTVSSQLWLSAGWHQVIVDGDGDTDLDLYIYNSRGRLLDADEDETDSCVTKFYVPRAG